MATSTPLNQQSLSAPERGRDEAKLHWAVFYTIFFLFFFFLFFFIFPS